MANKVGKLSYMNERSTIPVIMTRYELPDTVTAAPATEYWDADIAEAVEAGRITIRRANRIQAARAAR